MTDEIKINVGFILKIKMYVTYSGTTASIRFKYFCCGEFSFNNHLNRNYISGVQRANTHCS